MGMVEPLVGQATTGKGGRGEVPQRATMYRQEGRQVGQMGCSGVAGRRQGQR